MLLIQAVMAAYNDDADTIWITMLVFAVLAAGAGLWSFVKKKSGRLDEQQEGYSYYSTDSEAGHRKWKWSLQEKEGIETPKKHFAVTSSRRHSSDLEMSAAGTLVSPKRSSADRRHKNYPY